VETRERGLLFALSELSYLEGEHLRHSVKAWEPRDCRDYYLSSAIYAWLFLFADSADEKPSAFDQRFRDACDLYNYALGWALTSKQNTNLTAILTNGLRTLPCGSLDLRFVARRFPFDLSLFDQFVVADHYLVRGFSVRNRQAGLGAPLVALAKPQANANFRRAVPCTVLLRYEGNLADLGQRPVRASLELYAASDESGIQVAGQAVPLETDTTIATAYALNQPFLWRLGMRQFLSSKEQVGSQIYLTQPYEPGRVPVVFVHGTFSSPAWWAEMVNTLTADPELRRRCQFWYFVYNSGNPLVYSASRLRVALETKVHELDPRGSDRALRQMVVIGHSQGGLLAKLTACSTGDVLCNAVLKTNRAGLLKFPRHDVELVRRYTTYEPLPYVKRVVFISTPHRGSYLAGSFARNIARKLVTLPSKVVQEGAVLARLQQRLDLPPELRGPRTSLDSMSPRNPVLLALADIPLAPGVTGHSIISVKGNGDFHEGKDGLVSYQSAHVDYVESEFIVRSFHSCQQQPATIEEVRRILHEHLAQLPPQTFVKKAL
jgi:pimeloyl-ACP methyl ester carboxylesterase